MMFAQFQESLDPDAPLGKIFIFPIVLFTGISLVSAEVAVVDQNSKAIDPAATTTISNVTFGIEDAPTNRWAVAFRALGGNTSAPAEYWIYVRCRFTTSDGQGDDITGRILVAQG